MKKLSQRAMNFNFIPSLGSLLKLLSWNDGFKHLTVTNTSGQVNLQLNWALSHFLLGAASGIHFPKICI